VARGERRGATASSVAPERGLGRACWVAFHDFGRGGAGQSARTTAPAVTSTTSAEVVTGRQAAESAWKQVRCSPLGGTSATNLFTSASAVNVSRRPKSRRALSRAASSSGAPGSPASPHRPRGLVLAADEGSFEPEMILGKPRRNFLADRRIIHLEDTHAPHPCRPHLGR